jgi:hypothetical protein
MRACADAGAPVRAWRGGRWGLGYPMGCACSCEAKQGARRAVTARSVRRQARQQRPSLALCAAPLPCWRPAQPQPPPINPTTFAGRRRHRGRLQRRPRSPCGAPRQPAPRRGGALARARGCVRGKARRAAPAVAGAAAVTPRPSLSACSRLSLIPESDLFAWVVASCFDPWVDAWALEPLRRAPPLPGLRVNGLTEPHPFLAYG